jgi:hypothetical protein
MAIDSTTIATSHRSIRQVVEPEEAERKAAATATKAAVEKKLKDGGTKRRKNVEKTWENGGNWGKSLGKW